MKKVLQAFTVCLFLLSMTGCGGTSKNMVMIAETDETISNWIMARQYQAQGRYELAHQHYGLAMSAVRTQSSLNMLQRELAAVDLQIKTMR